jgi:NitT/TauT family transport system substrate-binding protein
MTKIKKPNGGKFPLAIMLLGALAAVLASLSWYTAIPEKSPTTSTNPSAKRQKITVGYLPIYVDLPLFVAVEEGLFKKRNLDVALKRFENSPDMGTAFSMGQIQAVASIAAPTAFGIEQRDPGSFKIAIVDEPTPTAPLSSLMIPKNSPISDVNGLSKKTVASFPGPTAKILAPLAFEKYQMTDSMPNIVDIPLGSHVEVLLAGTVDAVITYEPVATQLEVQHGAKRLVRGFIESTLLNPWPAGLWLVNADPIKLDKEVAKSYVDALEEAVELINANPESMKRHLGNYTSIDKTVALAAPNIRFATADNASQAALGEYLDLLVASGTLERKLDVQQLMYKPQ